MAKYKVVITDREYEDIDNELRILQELGDVEVLDYQLRDEDQVIEIAKDCDALIIQYAKATKKVIGALEHCKVIAKYAIGIDGIDIAEATKKGICVTNVNDYCADEVSTHAAAMLLDTVRRTQEFNARVKAGEWYHMGIKIPSLEHSVIGVISFGRIARAYIDKIKPFCDQIWVFDKFVPEKDLAAYGVLPKSLEEILSGADYISIHAPLTEETRHMFDKEAFKMMKPSASIINVARGALIKEEDLIWALQNQEIAFAALDVLETEPPQKDSPLLQMDNVMITPHTAWYSTESQKKLQSTVAEDVVRVLQGKIPGNLVNRELASLFEAEK